MKKRVLLLIPTMFVLASCSLFDMFSGKGGEERKQDASTIYLKTEINVTGQEVQKEAFLAAIPEYQTISPETKGYNYCTVSYLVARNNGSDARPGHPGFILQGDDTWFWKIDQKGDGIYANGPEAINKTAAELVAADPVSGDTRECKYIIGQEEYYFASRSTQVIGKTTHYRRYEYKFNKWGDVVSAVSYEGHITDKLSSEDSYHVYTVAFSIKQS